MIVDQFVVVVGGSENLNLIQILRSQPVNRANDHNKPT